MKVKKSMDIVEYVNKQRKPRTDHDEVHADLGQHYSCGIKVFFACCTSDFSLQKAG